MSRQRSTTSDLKQTVVDEMKQKSMRPRSMPPEQIANLDDNHKPNMIYSSGSGSFIRSRQNRLLRASSSGCAPNTGQQGKRQAKKQRSSSSNEKGMQEFSKSTREKKSATSSKSNAKSIQKTTTMEINRRPSHGEISPEKRSQSSGSLSRSRSNSRGNLKSYEMPTASSSARSSNAEGSRSRSGSTVELHTATLSMKEKTPVSPTSLSRSSSKSSLKSNASQSKLTHTSKTQLASASSKEKTSTPLKGINPSKGSTNIKSISKSLASPAESMHPSNRKIDVQYRSNLENPPKPAKTSGISYKDANDSEEEYQEITETIIGGSTDVKSLSKAFATSAEGMRPSRRQIDVEYRPTLEHPTKPPKTSEISYKDKNDSEEEYQEITETIIGGSTDVTSFSKSFSKAFATPAQNVRSSNMQSDVEYRPNLEHPPKPLKKSEISYKDETDSEEEYQEITETIYRGSTDVKSFSKDFATPAQNMRPSNRQIDVEYRANLEHPQKPPKTSDISYKDDTDSEEEYQEITETIIGGSTDIKSFSKSFATPAERMRPNNNQIDVEYRPTLEQPPALPQTSETSYDDETDSEEEYQEITETVIITLPQSPRYDSYSDVHQESPSSSATDFQTEPNQAFHPSDHFQSTVSGSRSLGSQRSQPDLIQDDSRITSTSVADVSTSVALRTSLSIPVHDDKTIASPTSIEVLDYFNTTLAGYATSRSRASTSGTDSQSYDSHDYPNEEIILNASGESVFSNSHRSSIASTSTLTGHSGSESDSEFSSQDARSQDHSDLTRHCDAGAEIQTKRLTGNFVPSSHPKGRKRKKEDRIPKVIKYEENVESIRQHIKPGTVEGLTHLFDESEMPEKHFTPQRSQNREYVVQDEPEAFYHRSSTKERDRQHLDPFSASETIITQSMHSRENSLLSKSQRERRRKELNEKTSNIKGEATNYSSPYSPYLSDSNIESTMATRVFSSRNSYAGEECENRENANTLLNLYLNSQNTINDDKWSRNSFLDRKSSSGGPYANASDKWEDSPFLANVIFTNEAGNKDVTSDSLIRHIDTRNQHNIINKEVYSPRLDTVSTVAPNLTAGAKKDPSHKSSFYNVTSGLDSKGDTNPRHEAQSGESGVGVRSLLTEFESRLKSGTDVDEVLPSRGWDTPQEIVLSTECEVQGEGRSLRRKRSLKLSHREDDHLWDSMSIHSTGSAGGESLTSLASWTTLDDIAFNDDMIDHVKDPVYEKSSPKTDPTITSAEYTRETTLIINGGDGNSNVDESKTAHYTSKSNFSRTESGHASHSNGHTSHPVTNGYEIGEVQVNSRMDGEKAISKTEQERQAERADYVITQLPTDLSSQTTGLNLFAHTASREMERGGKGRRDDTSDNEEENERREKQTHGTVTVDRKAHLGQISTSFTSAQVEINETHSNDETHPSQVGVPQSEDFNAILNGLDLNAVSDSQLSPSENTYNEQVISYEENSLENRSLKNDSMKRKKNVKKSSSTGSDRNEVVTSNVSLIKDTYVSGQQLDQLDKTISDDDGDISGTKQSHGSIDDEIRELHLQLSPGISNNIVEETTFNLLQSVESNRGSLSSRSSTVRDQTPQRETVFNRDFFTSDHNIKEEKNESGVQFGVDDNDHKNQVSGLTLSSRTDGAEISYSPEGGRAVSSETNGEVTSADITHLSSSFTQRNLPVNKGETDTLLQTGGSHTVVVGDITEKREDCEDSDSISSHSSKSESVNDNDLTNEKLLTDDHGYSPLKVTSARSQEYEVSGRSDHSLQQNLSLKSDDHSKDEETRKSRSSSSSSSSSSVTSSSDSDEKGAVSGSNQSGKRKKKHRKSDIFEISKSEDDDFTTGDGEVKRNVFVRQEHIRSISKESGQSDNKHTGRSTTVSIETNEEYLLEKKTRTEEETNMAAIVGEVSSFNIHRKVTSVEESSTVPSDRSSSVTQIQTMPVEGGAQPDIFLIQDKSGDVYALQEVGTANNSSSTQSVTTIHTVNRDDYSSQATSVQPALFSGGNYQTDHSHTDADIFVDSASVNDDKAREVIAAYLNSGSNTVANQSLDSNFNRGISSLSQFHSGSVVDHYSRQLDDSRINASDSVFVNNTVPSNASTSPHSIVVHQGMRENDFLKNSTVTVNQEVNAKTDTSQTWDIHGYEPYTTGSGGEEGYRSSAVVTNFNTPQQQAQVTYSSQPRVDTSFDSQRSNSFMNTSQTASAFQPLNINVSPDQGVAPFATRPITIQTTTNAVVGEKVDMTIDFPPGEQKYPPRKITATAELATSSSDDENKSHYVIRSAPPKSSMKRGSAYNSINTSFGSNPEIFYTKKETRTGEIVIGGKKRGTNSFDSRIEKTHTSARPDSFSPSSANSSTYIMHQNSNRDMESNRRDHRQEAHKVRKVNKSTYKHHSPERIFVNPKLSLRKPDYQGKNASSDEETQNQRYKTVTRISVDGDENRSRSSSSSPTNQYRIQNQNSFNRSRDDDVQSHDGKSYQILTVKSKGHKDSGSGSFSENDSEMEMSEQRRLYKVVNKSDLVIDRHDVRAHSSPNPENISSTSIEEAVIHRTERVQPSRYQRRPSSKSSHKTVIQLEVGDQNRIKEKSRSESQTSGSTRSGMARAKSMDILNSRENFTFNRSLDNARTWRTSRARSVDLSSDGTSSSDFEDSGPLNLSSSGLVKTLKQKKGNKTYVVNSTINDQHRHPSGYYKSTIDINEDLPDGAIRSHNVSLNRSRNLRDDESFQQTDRTTEKHNSMFTTEEKSVYYVRQSSQQPNPHHVTKLRVHPSPDSGQGTEVASSDGENELHKQKFERVERIYEVKTEPVLPEQFQSEEEVSKDLRVLRGKILIKNRLDSDHDDDDFDQNVNVFDNSFHMDKDNPLYSSDTDLQASLQREEEEELRRQINQDITFEQVSKIARRNKTNSSKLEVSPKPRRKQNLSTLLLSKLANVDSQDIRQTIDVQHHNEEIFGYIDFIHADGQHTGSQNTSNFDSVSEKVELTLQQGKAFVIIKVIAERIVPTDYEFNVWRKSQAIVTRQIEVDLLANDQRRRFYNHVMDSQGLPAAVEYHYDSDGRRQDRLTSQEKQLSSLETLKLFSQILDVADGQGEQDHTSMSTKQEMGQLPASGADLLY